jgi:hypothetical protein
MHWEGTGEEVHYYSFYTSAPDGGGFHAPATLPLGKSAGTHLIGGQMGPRAVLDVLPILEFEPRTVQPVA